MGVFRGSNKKATGGTNTQTDTLADGHCDSKTYSAQMVDSVKSVIIKRT